MPKSVSEDIHERAKINETLRSFYSLPEWTPAMGALLLCGVIPMSGCSVIPSDGPLLRDSAVPAHPRQFLEARQTLQNWIDWYLDRTNHAEDSPLPTSVLPHEFLAWCQEEYENASELSKPGWLNYWLSFLGIGGRSDVPSDAPGDLVAHAAKLDHFASIVSLKSHSAETGSVHSELSSAVKAYVRRMRQAIEADAKTPIASAIIEALAASDDPKKPGAVWVQLCKMAQSEKHGTLRYKNDSMLEIPHEDGWKPFRRGALGQFLRRYQIKVAEDSQTAGS